MAKQGAKLHHQLMVQYQFVNGSHFFVGTDGCAETIGLCVGSRDLKEAFDRVAPALMYLLKRNYGLNVTCTPKWPFHEFVGWLLGQIKQELVTHYPDRGVDSVSCVAPARGKAKQWTIPNLERSAFTG